MKSYNPQVGNFRALLKNNMKQKGFAHIFIFLIVIGLVIFIGVFLLVNYKNSPPQTNKQVIDEQKQAEKFTSNPEKKLVSYPETDSPPTLTLFWGKDKKVGIPYDIVLETGQFGTFEGGGQQTPFKVGLEPNSEMEINLKVGEYPIYSFSKGLITNIENSEQGEITIKYGRKYALKHLHIKNLSPSLKIGDKIEAGTLLGYTQTGSLGDGSLTFSFIEIELDKIISDRAARAINVYDYFDQESKDSLENIRQVAPRNPKRSWVASFDDKTKSWIPYVGKVETWADMHKIGFNGDLESFEEFAKNNNLEWVLK